MISKLHYITQETNTKSHIQLCEEACQAGITWVQLRVKDKNKVEWLTIAQEVKSICKKYNAKLIINDNVEIAEMVKADGVHLGKSDMDPSHARKILGDSYIIGGTANTFNDILTLKKKKVDYIGLGPFHFTATKKDISPILGMDGYQQILHQCSQEDISIPIIAIGGIQSDDVMNLVSLGIYGVAVSSFISLSDDKKNIVRELRSKLDQPITA